MGNNIMRTPKSRASVKKLQQVLAIEKPKLQRLLDIMKLGSHSHHQNRLATLRKCWIN